MTTLVGNFENVCEFCNGLVKFKFVANLESLTSPLRKRGQMYPLQSQPWYFISFLCIHPHVIEKLHVRARVKQKSRKRHKLELCTKVLQTLLAKQNLFHICSPVPETGCWKGHWRLFVDRWLNKSSHSFFANFKSVITNKHRQSMILAKWHTIQKHQWIFAPARIMMREIFTTGNTEKLKTCHDQLQ